MILFVSGQNYYVVRRNNKTKKITLDQYFNIRGFMQVFFHDPMLLLYVIILNTISNIKKII